MAVKSLNHSARAAFNIFRGSFVLESSLDLCLTTLGSECPDRIDTLINSILPISFCGVEFLKKISIVQKLLDRQLGIQENWS